MKGWTKEEKDTGYSKSSYRHDVCGIGFDETVIERIYKDWNDVFEKHEKVCKDKSK